MPAEKKAKPSASTGYRGDLFDWLVASGIGREALRDGRSMRWVSRQLQTYGGRNPSNSATSSAMRAVAAHYETEEEAAAWQREWSVSKMLMAHRPDPPSDPAELEKWIEESTDNFFEFEQTFWELPNGKPFIRKPFHRGWVKALLFAMATGGKLMILSPPRHGKTELLQHLCVWLICRFPNIRIIWVGPNGPIAEETVGAIKEILEQHRGLSERVLGPGGSFAPKSRQGSRWSEKRFTTETRTVMGMKAPTMTAMGRAAKTLSKDADLIIADDLEDHDSTSTPGPREDTRKWFFTQLQSRKQVNTAWFTIGSRQHPDDLWGYLLDDDSWEHIVETAHDPTCPHDPFELSLHVECMLFPEVNPYKWLFENWISARTLGNEHLYEMVYLNNPRPEGTVHWTRDLISVAHDPSRGLGIPTLADPESSLFLVGGLDPSATRFQAAFCWAVELFAPRPHPNAPGVQLPGHLKQWMVDLDNHQGGGVDAFLDGIGAEWLEKYQLRHWVVEYNLYRHVFSKHQRVLDWQAENNITLEWIETQGANKWDPTYGVGAMRQLYVADPIEVSLPTGTAEARQKVETYTLEMLRYTDEPSVMRKRTTNVLMASWFPQRTARRWLAELVASTQDQGFMDEFSYPGLSESEYGDSPY